MSETLLKASVGLDKFPSIDAALKNHKHHAENIQREREREKGRGRGEGEGKEGGRERKRERGAKGGEQD